MSRSTAHRPLRRRTAVTAALVAVAALTLGCQSNMGSAAYVGDHRISDSDLSAAVDRGLADPQIRKVVDDNLNGDVAAYRRVVLDTQVQHALIAQAGNRLHVSASDSEVSEQLALLALQAGGEDQVRALFARNGLTQQDGEAVIRDEVLMAEIGYATGAERPTDSALRDAYESNRAQYTTLTLGVIQTPDAATAAQVRDQLDQDPATFDTLARRYAGGETTPTPQQVGAQNLNQALLDQIDKVEPGHAVVYNPQVQGGVPELFAVIQVVKRDVVPFETVLPQLRAGSLSAAQNTAAPYLAKLAKEIGVKVNPRYGTWDFARNQVADLPDPMLKLRPEPGSSAQPGQPVPGQPVPGQPVPGAPGAGDQGGADTSPSD